MKKPILIYSFCVFFVWFYPNKSKSQENETISFKEFINLLDKKGKDKNIQISDSIYLQFINEELSVDEESETSIKILLERESFVGLIINFSLDMGRREESNLLIYDWEGNLITKFEYGSILNGDYFSESTVCELLTNDTLECRHAINEGTLEEVKDDDDNVIGINYITVKEEVTSEYYKILPDGNIETIELEEEGD